jgi:hypothetical protein
MQWLNFTVSLRNVMLSWNRSARERCKKLPQVMMMLSLVMGETTAAQANNQQQETTVPQGRDALEFYGDQAVNTVNDEPERLSDERVAYPVSKTKRLRPLLEIGDPFLGSGPIRPGTKTPTGQMLQPWFLLFGTLRTATQSYDDGNNKTAEWSNRLDLHGNLNLSGTERLLVSLRPLDSDKGTYSGYNFKPDRNDGWQDQFSGKLTRFFFEGELGEIFPGLDPTDSGTLDWGFSVGRQPIAIQDGILVNDTIDLIGVTRNSLIANNLSNLRITGLYGWNEVDQSSHQPGVHDDSSAQLYAMLFESDTGWDSTVAMDIVHIDDQGDSDAWYLGLGTTQRIGTTNTTFRINSSIPEHADTATVGNGTLLSAEISQTLSGTENLLYLNTFWSINHFTSAARSHDEGTPVANLGLLYSPVGMGRYAVPLGQPIADTVGVTLGYQRFFNGIRKQLVMEMGLRASTKSEHDGDILGIGARYQQAIGQRFLLRLDSFIAAQKENGRSHGIRLEWVTKF